MKISAEKQTKDLGEPFYQPDLEIESDKVIFFQRTIIEKYIAIDSANFERIKKSYKDFVQKVSDLQALLNSKEELTDSESKKVHEFGESLQILFEKFWVQFIILGVID